MAAKPKQNQPPPGEDQSSVRPHLRAPRIVLVIGLVGVFIVGFVCFLPRLLNPQYFGLRNKSPKYYADFTAACDSIIAAHPLGTNGFIKIPVADPSLPKIVTDLHPIRMNVTSRRVWLLLGSDGHAGFGLAWEPQYGHTNVWILHTIAEGLDTVIYTAAR